jgi:hypothetical protein
MSVHGYTIADSEREGLPAAKAEETYAGISLRGLIAYFQEALWGEKFRIAVHCGIMKHVPRVRRQPDYTHTTTRSRTHHTFAITIEPFGM